MVDSASKKMDFYKPTFQDERLISIKEIKKEELSIDDLHRDLEKKLEEEGFIFDKRKFILTKGHLTFGQRLAEKVADFGGSWKFIILFGVFMLLWIIINGYFLLTKSFDPYPFFLLSFILSILAGLQAPVIIMSQNRQAQDVMKQAEINLEKDIVDFKQDRLDLILDEKQRDLLVEMDNRLKRIEDYLNKDGKKIKVSTKKSKRK